MAVGVASNELGLVRVNVAEPLVMDCAKLVALAQSNRRSKKMRFMMTPGKFLSKDSLVAIRDFTEIFRSARWWIRDNSAWPLHIQLLGSTDQLAVVLASLFNYSTIFIIELK